MSAKGRKYSVLSTHLLMVMFVKYLSCLQLADIYHAGEPVTLTATTAHGDSPSKSSTSPAEPVERRSYVIRDEDDSDDDDLVDVDDETKQNAEKGIKEKAS